jgi:glycosyltransferase involved in cell wall biosynthesis
LLEAWSYRKPVILVAAGESAELVERSDGGQVVAPGDATQLADTLRQMKNSPARSREQGESGFEFVKTNLDRPLLAKQFSRVLKSVVANH